MALSSDREKKRIDGQNDESVNDGQPPALPAEISEKRQITKEKKKPADKKQPEPNADNKPKKSRMALFILLPLLIAMGWALYYLNQTIEIIPETVQQSLSNTRYAAKRWMSNLFEKKTKFLKDATDRDLPPLVTHAEQKKSESTVALSTTPIKKTRQVIAKVRGMREDVVHAERVKSEDEKTPENHSLVNEEEKKQVHADDSLKAQQIVETDIAHRLAANTETVKKKVIWPDIVVSGLVGKGKRGGAIINNDLIMIGDKNSDGVLLDHLASQSVVLKYEGETRRFTLK